MDKVTVGFLFLLGIIFVSSLFLNESFVDASGSQITLSITDLFSLLGSKSNEASVKPKSTPMPPSSQGGAPESSFDQEFYNNLKGTIVSDVRQTVRDSLQSYGSANVGGPVLTDSCINSVADQQGADFMRYIPGKNPADYIRKDSIPCYGCSL